VLYARHYRPLRIPKTRPVELTLHELTEVLYWHRQAMATDMSIFMTLLFGYLLLVYFVGAKLDRTEAWLITILYSSFALFLLIGLTATTGRLITTGQQAGILNSYPNSIYMGPMTMFFSWVLSIWYMARTRTRGV